MSWVRLDDRFFLNPKVSAVPAEAKLLHLCAMTWCAAELTDGEVPAHSLPMLAAMAGLDLAVVDDAVEALSGGERPLWIPLGVQTDADEHVHADATSWRINDWSEFNESASVIKSKRKRDAERKRKVRTQQVKGRKASRPSSRPPGIQADSARNPSGLQAESSGPNPNPLLATSGYQHSPVVENEPEPSPPSSPPPKAGNHEATFGEIWRRWPRQTGRQPAYAAWRNTCARHPLDQVIAGIFAYAEHRTATGVPCMELGRFLTEDRWAEWVDGPPDGEKPARPDRASNDAAIDAGVDRVFAELEEGTG